MPIDFAKYGGTDSPSKSKESGIKLDFSKYAEPSNLDHANENAQYADLMKQAYNNNPESFAPISHEPSFFEKAGNVASSVGHFLNYPFAKIAEYAVPNAPMIGTRPDGSYGNLEGTNARQQFTQENPIPSSGNATFDKIGDVAGQFIGPMVGTMGTGTGALVNGAESVLAKYGAKFGDSLGGKIAKTATEGALVGAPLNAAATLTASDPTLGQLGESAALGAGLGAGLGALGKYAGTKIGQAFDNWRSARNPQAEQQVTDLLALPPGRGEQRLNAAMDRSNLSPNESPIAGQGRIADPLALPEPNLLPPTTARLETKPNIYTQKLENLFDTANKQNFTPGKELEELNSLWSQMAGPHDPALNDLIDLAYPKQTPKVNAGSLSQARSLQQSREAAGVPSLVKSSSDRYQTMAGDAGMPRERVGLREAPQQTNVESPKRLSDTLQSRPQERNANTPQPLLNKSELKFAQTVKQSEHTNPELTQRLEDQTLTGKRTSDVINQTNAAEYIKQHGQEGAANKIIAKQGTLTPHEVTAAQILAKQYSSMGGETNLNKALDLVGKTATKGREMGQAIQALSQWNKLDSEGALLQATRSVGRTLTPAEGKPIVAAADRVQQVAATKSLADEVMSVVTNKQTGEALTEGEKATIKQFQDQVNKVNQGIKPFLPKERGVKANATIKEVSQIEPKARTRDQVVSFLDAKAEQARQRISASRNIGFAAVNKGNPIADYAIIGASHIAKGVVKLSDFTEQMIKDFGESIKPHIDEVFNKATNIFRKENGLPTVQELDRVVNGAIKNGTFTEEQAHQFKAWASEIGHMSNEFKMEATQDLQKAMNEIGTSTLGQKLSTIQTSAQLLSLPTAMRNVVGNEAFNVVEKVNKVNAVPIDWALSKITGERTIVFRSGNQEKYWDNFVKGAKSGWKGVSPNGQFASLDIHPEAFKSDLNPFKYLQKATGAMLQSFDHAAYMRAYGRTLGEYSKITGKTISELDQSIHDIADHAGQYATFQDDTFLSKIATGTKRLLNKPTDMLSDALVNKGIMPESISLKGFGAGDLILKYAKTPANIIMRGIDYSPIGILRGMGELLPLLTKKEFNQRAATLALSRGITGTLGMTGLGVALVSAGVLTGPSSSDPDIRSLDQQTGKGEYKVNWSALSRYITNGLDKSAAQWQKGDRIFDWGWLQPMAISIAMGVNAQQSVAKQKADGTKSYVGVAKDALVGSMKTILQQPLLSGVQNLVSGVTNVAKYGSWSGIANIFKGAPASFVPALSNQARNFTDNTTRNTYDPSAVKEALNMVINRIPGLDKQLPTGYDTLGNAKEQIQGGKSGTLAQGLKSFASPVKTTNYTVTPEAKMIIDLINSSGDNKAAPRSPNKYLMVDKKKFSLTPDQYSQIQQQTGMLTQQALSKIAPMLEKSSVKDEIKVKEVMSVLDNVGQQIRSNFNKQYPEFKPKKAVH